MGILKNKIFIQEGRRAKILKILHHGNQGITRALQNIRQLVCRHGLTQDVEVMFSRCQECQKLRPSTQNETLKADYLPENPYDVISADVFYVGRKAYMVYSDRLAANALVMTWYKNPNTGPFINVLQKYFSIFGKPLTFRSDGGNQFISMEMRKFLEEYRIEQSQSSPYNYQSNGHAERNVKIAKEIIMKTGNDINSKQFLDGIAQIRNTA